MQNLLKWATLAVFALQLLSPPQTIATDTHDLDSSGCFFGNFPEVTTMKKINAALHYHVHHDLNDQPVPGSAPGLGRAAGLESNVDEPGGSGPLQPVQPCVHIRG